MTMLLLSLFLFLSFAAGVTAPEDVYVGDWDGLLDRLDGLLNRFDGVFDRLDKLYAVLKAIASNVAPVPPSWVLAALLLFCWYSSAARRLAAAWKFLSRWVESVAPANSWWSRALVWCVVFVNRLLQPFRIEDWDARVHAADQRVAAAEQQAADAIRRAEEAAANAEQKQQEAAASLARITAICEQKKPLIATLQQQNATLQQQIARLMQGTTSEG
ncbi:hypothetical protein EKO04_006434 [Ascochyta lentis]|uniref:Uncharacterized protein n=1 Tax=Ascochyta lentis TaxID=205686 RepID=A0A8H7J2N4_9PLEO|nr:hypothetical protein EKO04_006434 [Ascochyta lentis]